jgi:hypothetical protein
MATKVIPSKMTKLLQKDKIDAIGNNQSSVDKETKACIIIVHAGHRV